MSNLNLNAAINSLERTQIFIRQFLQEYPERQDELKEAIAQIEKTLDVLNNKNKEE